MGLNHFYVPHRVRVGLSLKEGLDMRRYRKLIQDLVSCPVEEHTIRVTLTRMDFFHPVISKSCEAMGVASQGAIVQSITGWKKSCRRVVCFMLKHQGKARPAGNEHALGKGRNTALALWGGSLRASAGGRSAVLHSFELVKASPALMRLAAHPASTR
jgi:hypothetical protein